jgi:hypothetical protein
MFRSNNTKTTTVLIVVALATVMIMGPQVSSVGDVFAKQKYKDWEDCRDDHSKNWCKKYFKNHNDDGDDGNRASQGIGQSQSSSQNSQVVSGGDSIGSGNNFNFQNQENSGNNALAQDSGDDDGDGNRASQGIGQSQSSSQNSQVVSGGDSIGSGNNFNFQNQENSGNNALAQQ